MKNYLLAVIIIITSSVSLTAQTSSQPAEAKANSWYLHIDNLTVENYPALYHGLKENPDFSLTSTCKPAKVTVIGLRSNAVDKSADFRDLEALLISLGFSGIREMENPGMESFEAECLKFRRN